MEVAYKKIHFTQVVKCRTGISEWGTASVKYFSMMRKMEKEFLRTGRISALFKKIVALDSNKDRTIDKINCAVCFLHRGASIAVGIGTWKCVYICEFRSGREKNKKARFFE